MFVVLTNKSNLYNNNTDDLLKILTYLRPFFNTKLFKILTNDSLFTELCLFTFKLKYIVMKSIIFSYKTDLFFILMQCIMLLIT